MLHERCAELDGNLTMASAGSQAAETIGSLLQADAFAHLQK